MSTRGFRSGGRAKRFNACRADQKGFGGFIQAPLLVGERAGVRGAGFDPAQQLRQNAVQILQYVQITETQHLQPLALQMRCS